jgi:phenylpropionate dioxygenase-like ring-hydroxylating dioxygenase large terminal subunit
VAERRPARQPAARTEQRERPEPDVEVRPRRPSPGRTDWSTWPVYAQATLGLRNFWYPVLWSSELTGRPVSVKLLGENVALVRDGGKAYALHDRCPHRGVPLSLGSRQFPGTLSCAYHGWTYRLTDGALCAAITDGPASPITGKVRVRTYPVAERLGLVWVFAGDGDAEAPPVEGDIPEELLSRPISVGGRIQAGRSGNWRYAAENGFDEGHAKYLHRNSLWAMFRQLPVWNETKVARSPDNRWVIRRQQAVHWEDTFPGLGPWSQARWWKVVKTAATPGAARSVDSNISALDLPAKASVRLPYILRIAYPRFIHYEWAVPEDAEHHRYVQILVSFTEGVSSHLFRLAYLGYIRWAFHGQFTGQDAWMVDVMDIPPERLYRPDSSVIEWRKLVEEQHRESPQRVAARRPARRGPGPAAVGTS